MRRWRPAERQPAHQHRHPGAAPIRRAPFFVPDAPITSPHNEKLKEIRKLRQRRRARDRAGRFVAEGEDLLAAADAAGWTPVERYVAAGSGLAGTEVEPELLDRAAGLGVGHPHAGRLRGAVARAPPGPLCVYLHGVHDPGNVGTVLRSAAAFGAACVSLGPGSADPFSPKAVRASMGAVFEVPLAARATTRRRSRARRSRWIRTPTAAERCWRIDRVPHAEAARLLVGAEREGLPADVIAHARPRRPDPHRHPFAERGDGGHASPCTSYLGCGPPA